MGIRSPGFRVEPGMTKVFQISQFTLRYRITKSCPLILDYTKWQWMKIDGKLTKIPIILNCNEKKKGEYGGPYRDRTGDLHAASVALSQLS